MNALHLDLIYDQLKEKYDVELTSGLQLDAGFDWDIKVLTGEGPLGRFYLYDEVIQCTLDYDTEGGLANRHWHPQDNAEALNYVVAFIEGTIV